MTRQPQVNERMRAILIDWLVDVHTRYRQHPETFYLTVSILDRFMERTPIARSKLQLVGATCMLIASKFCESYKREVRVDELVYICDQTYPAVEVRDAERQILHALDFRVAAPTPYIFLSRVMRVARASTNAACMSSYLLERMQQEYDMLKYKPSAIAAAVANLALRTFDGDAAWTPLVEETAGYTQAELRDCIVEVTGVASMYGLSKHGELSAVFRKYSQDHYASVALAVLPDT